MSGRRAASTATVVSDTVMRPVGADNAGFLNIAVLPLCFRYKNDVSLTCHLVLRHRLSDSQTFA